MEQTLFTVLAFRYGGFENVFPIGIFTTYEAAKDAAKEHHFYRGGKYDHRIYEFIPDKSSDDVGHRTNNKPCIESKN